MRILRRRLAFLHKLQLLFSRKPLRLPRDNRRTRKRQRPRKFLRSFLTSKNRSRRRWGCKNQIRRGKGCVRGLVWVKNLGVILSQKLPFWYWCGIFYVVRGLHLYAVDSLFIKPRLITSPASCWGYLFSSNSCV